MELRSEDLNHLNQLEMSVESDWTKSDCVCFLLFPARMRLSVGCELLV